MSDVQDIDCVAAHSIENPEWVANDGGHPYLERCETRGAA
jgi:hypothetical protein